MYTMRSAVLLLLRYYMYICACVFMLGKNKIPAKQSNITVDHVCVILMPMTDIAMYTYTLDLILSLSLSLSLEFLAFYFFTCTLVALNLVFVMSLSKRIRLRSCTSLP